MVQSERGQKEISAAKVREVESELSKAQNSLKAERLLLQQASTPACFHVEHVCCLVAMQLGCHSGTALWTYPATHLCTY